MTTKQHAIKDTGKVGVITRTKGKLAWLKMEDGTTIKQPISNLTPVKRRRANGVAALITPTPVDTTALPNMPLDIGEIPDILRRSPVPEGMTDQIQIRIEGTLRAQTWRQLERSFSNAESAKLYLEGFSFTSITGKSAKLTAGGADLWANTDLRGILDGIEPKRPLPNILHHYRPTQRTLTMPKPSDTPRTTPQRTSRPAGNFVGLKEIIAKHKLTIEPKHARIRLRKATNLPPSNEGRWEWAPEHVEAVVAFLTATPAEKEAPAKVKPAALKPAPKAKSTAKAKLTPKTRHTTPKKKPAKRIVRKATSKGKK
jgi:hypothetical protein